MTHYAGSPESHKRGRPRCYPTVSDKNLKPLSAKQWRIKLIQMQTKWRTIKLTLAAKASTQALAIRVKEVITQAYYRPGRDYWLVIEKLGTGQYKYYVSNAPANTPLKKLMTWSHERWKVEQGYQQLKEEQGLDHFEGRSWRGLHHHFTLCLMAYAFLQLLRQTNLKKNRPNVAASPQVAKPFISNYSLSLLSAPVFSTQRKGIFQYQLT